MSPEELNEAVARKLGFIKRIDHLWSRPGPLEETPMFVLPAYSTFIAAAWELIPKFEKWSFSRTGEGDYVFAFSEFGAESYNAVTDPFAPRAICLAFLKLP